MKELGEERDPSILPLHSGRNGWRLSLPLHSGRNPGSSTWYQRETYRKGKDQTKNQDPLGEVLTWILGWPQKVPYPWLCTVKATPRTAWERQEVVQKKSPLLRPPDFPPGSHFGLPSRRLILPLHSGRGLGGSTWYKSVKTSVIPKNYSLFRTSESNRVSFLCLDQRCGLTAAKAQSLSAIGALFF